MTNNRPPLTVQETMGALGVSDSTVRRMLKEGVLREIQPRHGPIQIDPNSVNESAQKQRPQPEPVGGGDRQVESGE